MGSSCELLIDKQTQEEAEAEAARSEIKTKDLGNELCMAST